MSNCHHVECVCSYRILTNSIRYRKLRRSVSNLAVMPDPLILPENDFLDILIRWQIVLVDQSDRFVFKPLLYELLSKGQT